jgi:hypothetical protein
MASGKKSAGSTMNVLFIGNSFTARNDVPGMVAALAAAAGTTLEHELVSAGGASLRMHWNKGQAIQAIRRGRHDYVVLQEQSTLPIKNPARFHENVRLFDPEIRAAGAKTALYMTWARKHAPQSQRALTDGYNAIGKELGATVVPVGVAWERFLAKHDSPVLHDKDGSHPTPAGSYLAACVFFAVLLGRSPVGVGDGIKGVSAADTKLLQQAAWDVVG